MKVSEQDVLYVADLANLELNEAERVPTVRDLNSILEYVDRLDQLDTSDVPPMTQVASALAEPMRPDMTRLSLPREDALRNAPDTDDVFFKVPKVIER